MKAIDCILCISLFICSCQATSYKPKDFLAALNESEQHTIAEIKVKDSTFIPMLDQAIKHAMNCNQHDPSLIKFQGYLIYSNRIKGELIHDIVTNLSMHEALYIGMNENAEFVKLDHTVMGGFYYKGYLFTVPIRSGETNLIAKNPLFELTDCHIQVLANELPKGSSRMSSIRVSMDGEIYRVKTKMCRHRVVD